MTDEHDAFCDKWVRLPPDVISELWQDLIDVIDSMGIADEGHRRLVLETFVDYFNAAIKRRDAKTFH